MSQGKKKKADTTLCRNFCTYYKPGKNEDLSCQGFIVVRRLLGKGKRLSQEKPQQALAPDAGIIDGLQGRVCAACAFRESDCDFVLSGGTLPPCGGYAMLCHLLGSGDLTLEDLDEP